MSDAETAAPNVGGRPSIYSDELVDEFFIRVSGGRSVQSVASDEDMPALTTVYRWRDEKLGFREKLARAREERTETYASRMIALGEQALSDVAMDPQRINAAVNAYDKAARLQAPKKVEMSGPGGSPIPLRVEELTDAQLNEFIRRLEQSGSLPVGFEAGAAAEEDGRDGG